MLHFAQLIKIKRPHLPPTSGYSTASPITNIRFAVLIFLLLFSLWGKKHYHGLWSFYLTRGHESHHLLLPQLQIWFQKVPQLTEKAYKTEQSYCTFAIGRIAAVLIHCPKILPWTGQGVAFFFYLPSGYCGEEYMLVPTMSCFPLLYRHAGDFQVEYLHLY